MYIEMFLHIGQMPISISTSIYQASTICPVQSLCILSDVCLTIPGEKKQKTQNLDKQSYVLPKQRCFSTLCKSVFSSFNIYWLYTICQVLCWVYFISSHLPFSCFFLFQKHINHTKQTNLNRKLLSKSSFQFFHLLYFIYWTNN